MDELSPDLLLQYGYPVLVLVLAGAAFGLPLPATLLLVGAGAYASTDQLNLLLLLLMSLASVVVGDIASYWTGRRGGGAVVSMLGHRLRISDAGFLHRAFQRWGDLTVFLTRFLIAPLGPTVNLLAGIERYPFARFARAAIAGEIIWVTFYCGLGYTLGTAAPTVARLLGNVSAALALIALAAVLGVLAASELGMRCHRRLLEASAD